MRYLKYQSNLGFIFCGFKKKNIRNMSRPSNEESSIIIHNKFWFDGMVIIVTPHSLVHGIINTILT
jgi:hypothetical protein